MSEASRRRGLEMIQEVYQGRVNIDPTLTPHQAVTAAAGIAIACVSCDLSALSALGTRLLTDQPLPWLIACLAATASLVRIGATAPTVGRLLDTRAALA